MPADTGTEWTVAEIRSYVRLHMDVTEDDLPNDLIDRWVIQAMNRAYSKCNLWRHFQHTWTVSTSAGVESVYFASISESYGYLPSYNVLRDPVQFLRADGVPLPMVDKNVAEQMFPEGTPTGEPVCWSVWHEQVFFHPTPDDTYTYTLRGYRLMDLPVYREFIEGD